MGGKPISFGSGGCRNSLSVFSRIGAASHCVALRLVRMSDKRDLKSWRTAENSKVF